PPFPRTCDCHVRLPIRTFTVGPGVPPGQPLLLAESRVADCHRRLGISPTPEHVCSLDHQLNGNQHPRSVMSISSVWREIELPATGDWVDFEHESGLALRRPTFYAAAGGGAAAGGSTGPGDGAAGGAAAAGVAVVRKVRFAAPLTGRWRWTS